MTVPAREPVETLDVHITAGEAFPAFERLFLGARREIWCGFRVFDLMTRLRSPEARKIGETWFDLFEHTLSRGVDITLVLSDFDPIVATGLHEKSWESAHQLAAVDAVAGRGRLTFRVTQHPARVGLIPRLLLRGKVRDKLRDRDPGRYTPGLRDVSPGDIFDLSPVSHHQKLAVIDRETLYIGGLDLDERRFDTPDHGRAPDETWQDVQVVVTGPVVAAAQRHLESFERVTARRAPPAPRADGFLRTLSVRRWPALFRISPRPLVSEIETAHLDGIAAARDLIYLETQFLRHLPLARALADAGAARPDLRLIVVLPAAPEDVAFHGSDGRDARMGEHLQAQCVRMLREAFSARILVCSPARRVAARDTTGRDSSFGSPIIYVHSKVSIFDDSAAIVSSANLNGRSLRWDTEAGLHLTNRAHVTHLRDRLFTHWMPTHCPAPADTAAELVAAWQKIIAEDAARPPGTRLSRLVAYQVGPAQEMGENVPLVPNELV